MSSDVVVSIRNLTKTYRMFNHPGDRIKQALTFGRKKFHREFTALHDVSFDIYKGETVGIIGRNGSGKSTLLQLICGILKPTSGSVSVNGRVSALLELGSGFNPEFTGLENIYFQGAIMGFSKEEMDGKVDEVISFADIGEFIDQPVRTYSSGMFVRLAFAVAIYSEPDILVIDEALAVGDMEFQKKSFLLMSQMLADRKVTVILVSHELRQIQRFCEKALYLDKGTSAMWGDSQTVCQRYYDTAGSVAGQQISGHAVVTSSGEVDILGVRIYNLDGKEISEITSGEGVLIRFSLRLNGGIRRPEFIVGTHTSDLTYLSSSSSTEFGAIDYLAAGNHDLEYRIEQFPMASDEYHIRLNVRDENFRLLYAGRFLKSFSVRPELDGATRPARLLNLKSSLVIDDGLSRA